MVRREFVVGVDIGGTSTRALASDRSGTLGPIGRARGANPSTTSPDETRSAIAKAVDEATVGQDRLAMAGVVIGMAGLDAQRLAEIEASFRDAIQAPADIVVALRSDAEVAFAAGTDETNGIVLIAGTGAIASRIADHRESVTVDGHGWRLGDAGSGYWLGAAVLRRVLDALDGRAEPTALVNDVEARLALDVQTPPAVPGQADDPRRWAILRATARMRPAEVAAFADLALASDDPAAHRLVLEAATELERTVLALRPGPDDPIVLAGGLLRAGRLLDALQKRLDERRLVSTPLTQEPVLGAVALARRALSW